jgi:GTPase
MPTLDRIIQQLPPDTKDSLDSVWNTLSPDERSSLQALVKGMPNSLDLMRVLLRMASSQVKAAFGDKHRVAIIGPANVGKSTLYNQLVQNKVDSAQVSPLPGTTRVNQQADVGLFAIVDTPGADAVGEVGQKERDEAFQAAGEADFLVIVFDAIQGIKQTELDLYKSLLQLGKPHLVILNKIDLVKRHKREVLIQAAANLGLEPSQIIPLVAQTGQNLEQVLTTIAVIEPGMIAALGRALPQYRSTLARRTIISGASASAMIALTPLPIVDFIPLVAAQSIMILGIARIYNYEITLARARELVVTFGLGFLGRTLFYELSKLGGIPGWMLGAAIAASTTTVMGYAATVWFEKGERLSGETMTKITQSITSYLLDRLRKLGKKQPDQASLQEHIARSLEQAGPIETIQSTNSEPLSPSK